MHSRLFYEIYENPVASIVAVDFAIQLKFVIAAGKQAILQNQTFQVYFGIHRRLLTLQENTPRPLLYTNSHHGFLCNSYFSFQIFTVFTRTSCQIDVSETIS
jgi:hypothetical protein